MAKLGCGTWRAFITCRGGGELFEVPYASLSMGRKVDDMTSAQVAIDELSLNGATSAVYQRCCGVLSELEPWQHELALWRDTDPDSASWVGPVIQPTWENSAEGNRSLSIGARDLFQWMERRLLDRNRKFVATDLADIFYRYISDALHHDPTPNIDFAVSPTGILGDRSIDAFAFRRAADELRELARSGLDFTMVGRQMVIGGVEVPTANLGTLVNEHFRSLSLNIDGLQTETESTVVGARPNSANAPVYAKVGGVEIDRGLVQVAVTESQIEDVASAQAAADSRYALLGTSPRWITGVLSSDAPIAFSDLIPGAVADLRLGFLCREVVGDYRLQDVNVTADADKSEEIAVTFSSPGTTGEA